MQRFERMWSVVRNCGNCNYCEREAGDLVCVNDQSEYLADLVEETHTCDDWSGSEEDEEE